MTWRMAVVEAKQARDFAVHGEGEEAEADAARALLGLTRGELAEVANVSLGTLNNIERGGVSPRPASLQTIQLALEKAGIEFIDENGGGPGVRLRK